MHVDNYLQHLQQLTLHPWDSINALMLLSSKERLASIAFSSNVH